jgi:glycosyltransferase involved in cell wall biosynthesis
VVYVGGFLPLHGVPAVLEAVSILEHGSHRLPDFRVQLVGKGIEFERSRALAEQLGLERVDFAGVVDYADSPRVLGDAQVVLGAFGASDKAGRVIPHKVYQGLAAGRAVLTGDGPGVREVFEPDVTRDQPQAIAEALAMLLRDPARRDRLGTRGRERALEVATTEHVGESLHQALIGGGEVMP